jgi:hypothetical protein
MGNVIVPLASPLKTAPGGFGKPVCCDFCQIAKFAELRTNPFIVADALKVIWTLDPTGR